MITTDPYYVRRLWLSHVYRERYLYHRSFNVSKKIAAQMPKPVPTATLMLREMIVVPIGMQLKITIKTHDAYSSAAFNDFFEQYSNVYYLRRGSKKISFPIVKHMIREFGYDLIQPKT